MSYCSVYVTTGSREEAISIAKAVVGERLAACANVIPDVASVYWWQGELQEDAEVVLFLKTRRELVTRLSSRITSLHSYDCPCVVALEIVDGNPAYLDWIAVETGGASGG